MIRAYPGKPRSGITLTEILIAILIMGVGMVSVGTLFPIGLTRMREAVRDSRSTLLAESAVAEVQARDLLNGPSFTDPNLFWQQNGPLYPAGVDPWRKDYNRFGSETLGTLNAATGVSTPDGTPGLPVCYDPLFWANVHYTTSADSAATQDTPLTCDLPGRPSGRFGRGIGLLRVDPDGGVPNAHGLQRLTNFGPYVSNRLWPLTYSVVGTDTSANAEVAGDVFTSLDDVVFQPEGNAAQASSTLVPYDFDDRAAYFESRRDYEFSWMLTLRRMASGQSAVYDADIVVYHRRPLGFTSDGTPDGERVVEAVWAHATSPGALDTNGYSLGDDQTVLLRWNVATADPLVKVGSWIADVTYERTQLLSASRYSASTSKYPGQRCHWYRVNQVSKPENDPAFTNHRRMVVRVGSPVKAKTRLYVDGGVVKPMHVEAAVINPYIVNVFSTVLYSR